MLHFTQTILSGMPHKLENLKNKEISEHPNDLSIEIVQSDPGTI
jgi:hypothetical protein